MSKNQDSLIANLLEKIEEELGLTDFILIGTVNTSDGVMFNMITSWGLTNKDMVNLLLEGIATINSGEDEEFRH